ncbi:hypothetical protein OF829_17880 [Sphingomonas sp. LB-2]|uniref:site-2 protease family protein n=1 Tax=Sphingomonas caeni TaxID=2984949 RepID=UPI0022304B3B|nr:site-2 protease family protein [Sphingomonas caeni]MCW3849113.1 hypothetical protein [Sphingomonas caeni]
MRFVALLLYLTVNIAVIASLSELSFGSGQIERILLVLLLIFIGTLVHELGHAVAVRAVGGQIKTIVVVPFRLQLKPRRFKLTPPVGKGDLGGYVTYSLDRINARRGHAIIAVAGPAANVALTLAAGAAALLVHRPLADLATALAAVSTGMALLNLIPFRGSDGDHILFALSARYRRSRTRSS